MAEHRSRFVVALAPLVAGLCFGGCTVVPTNTSSDPTANFYQVSDSVYRGSRPTYEGLESMVAMHIKSILDLEDDDDAVAQEEKWSTALGISHFDARMSGTGSPSSTTVAYALDVLTNTNNAPVFVHCAKGEDRTGVIVALYRVFAEGWDASDAENEMENHGFDNALVALKHFYELKTGIDD